MQFLRRVGGEQYLSAVQNMLNEISKARLLLLDDEKRAIYDRQLKDRESSRKDGGKVSDSMSAVLHDSTFSLSAPAAKSLGRITAVQLLHLSGFNAGDSIELHARDITIGSSSKHDIMIPTKNGAVYRLEHEMDQWVLHAPDLNFAINGRLVNGLSVVKDGDILRFSPDGPDLQFIEQVDLQRHLEMLDQYESQVVRSASPTRPTAMPSGFSNPVTSGSHFRSTASQARASRSQSSSRVGSRTSRTSSASSIPRGNAQPANVRPQVESKLVKKPASMTKTWYSPVVDLANRAIGRNQSFEKKTGVTFDWQIAIFWLVVGSVLAAISAGIIFGWRW
jgi:curved DNA-binding protein CbpA